MKTPFAIIKLAMPVQLADRMLEEVTMRRPTLADELRYAPTSRDIKKQMQEEAQYFAHLCGLPKEDFELIDMEDYDRLQQQYLFFRGRKETGEADETGGGHA